MPVMRFDKSVQRVTVVRLGTIASTSAPLGVAAVAATASATPTATGVLYRKPKGKKRKISRPLALQERLVRRMVTAHNAVTGAYLDRHERSNRKRRDGWLQDFHFNTAKALSVAPKHLHPRRILPNVRLTPF